MGRITPAEDVESDDKCYYCGGVAQMGVFGTDMCADCAYIVFAPVDEVLDKSDEDML